MGLFEVEDVVAYPSAKEENKNKIALIDADTIVFGACSVHEQVEETLPRDMYTDEEWQKLLDNRDFDQDTGLLYTIHIQSAVDHAVEHVEKILAMTGCSSAELYFTSGMHFRYQVDPDYKANRASMHRPPGLNEVKAEMLKHYNGDICTEWEADDMVVYLKKQNPDKYVLCAVDKDVLKATEGEHWNYYQSSQYNIQPKWVEVDKQSAMRYNYLQAIMGDTNDGIKGVPGIGAKGAEKWVPKDGTEQDMWEGIVKAYESKGMTVVDAMITMQLVSMHQLVEVDGKPYLQLFNPTMFNKEVDYELYEE